MIPKDLQRFSKSDYINFRTLFEEIVKTVQPIELLPLLFKEGQGVVVSFSIPRFVSAIQIYGEDSV